MNKKITIKNLILKKKKKKTRKMEEAHA